MIRCIICCFWISVLLHCSLPGTGSEYNGKISGSTSIDNPVAEVVFKTSLATNSVDPKFGEELWLYSSANQLKKLATTTIKDDGIFEFSDVPFGSYDVVAKGDGHGALIRSITVSEVSPHYHIETLPYYSLKQIILSVADAGIQTIQYYDELLTVDSNGFFYFDALDRPESIEVGQREPLVAVQGLQRHTMEVDEAGALVGMSGAKAVANYCSELPSLLGITMVSKLGKRTSGDYIFLASANDLNSANDTYIFLVTQNDIEKIQIDMYGGDDVYYHHDFEYQGVTQRYRSAIGCCTTGDMVAIEIDGAVEDIEYIELSNSVMTALGFPCWESFDVQ